MNEKRWKSIMADDSMELTPKEILKGWHFCQDFDGLLVGPGMGEMKSCTCPPLTKAQKSKLSPRQ